MFDTALYRQKPVSTMGTKAVPTIANHTMRFLEIENNVSGITTKLLRTSSLIHKGKLEEIFRRLLQTME